MDTETQILNKAAHKLQKVSGILSEVKEQPKDGRTSFLLQLKWGENAWYMDGVVKGTINTAVIGQFKQNAYIYENPPVLITTYVNPSLAEHLRELQINYIDTAGNAYLNNPPLLIAIQGKRTEETPPTVLRLFRSTGLKIIFALLCNPGLEQKDYRSIASMADAALGSVNWIMKDLKQAGFLINVGKSGRKLIRKDELLEKWVTNYHEQLRPKIILGNYDALEREWWKKSEAKRNVLWGGELCANSLTSYLKPEVFTVYIREQQTRYLLKNKLHSTPGGKVEIVRQFWFFDNKWSEKNIVPPILIYADLIGSRSQRNIETAKMIYDREITGIIGEN